MYTIFQRGENDSLIETAKVDSLERGQELVQWLKKLWPERDYVVETSKPDSDAEPER